MTSKENTPDCVALFVSGIFQLILPKRLDDDTESLTVNGRAGASIMHA